MRTAETSKTVKIAVCHHKDGTLLPLYQKRPELFVHIHCGRAAYSGSSQFLLSMQGDDSCDNSLSLQNANCNEYSAMHWLWKSYAEIGNPDFISLFHYRRAFSEQEVEAALGYDMTIFESCLGRQKSPQHTMLQQFCYWHRNLVSGVEALASNAPPCVKPFLERFKTTKVFYPKNMFILKRDLFFKLMQILDAAYAQIAADGILTRLPRGSSFAIEQLTSLVLEHFIASGNSCQFAKLPDNYI